MELPAIISIGTSVPEHKVSQEGFLEFMSSLYPDTRENRLKMRKILLGSGIANRHSVLCDFSSGNLTPVLFKQENGIRNVPGLKERMLEYEKHALPLSLKAVDDCFSKIGWINLSEITHVVTFSCTGMYAPGLDIEIIESTEIPTSAQRFNINFMGCYAAFNAIKTAWHICRADQSAKVLVAGVELCSLHFNNIASDQQLVANSIFSDGAAAMLITSSKNIPISENHSLLLKGFHADFSSKTKQQMVWNIGERAFDLRLSPDVPDSIFMEIKGMVDVLLRNEEVSMEDISRWAIHPGGVKILQACERALGISADQNNYSYQVLKNYGNMSSVTVVFVLNELMKELTQNDKGKKVMSCAFGPGLTVESMLAEII